MENFERHLLLNLAMKSRRVLGLSRFLIKTKNAPAPRYGLSICCTTQPSDATRRGRNVHPNDTTEEVFSPSMIWMLLCRNKRCMLIGACWMVSTQQRQRLTNAGMELDPLLIYLFLTDIHDSVQKGLLPLSVHSPGCILPIPSNC
jgi:hypothetical protein